MKLKIPSWKIFKNNKKIKLCLYFEFLSCIYLGYFMILNFYLVS